VVERVGARIDKILCHFAHLLISLGRFDPGIN